MNCHLEIVSDALAACPEAITRGDQREHERGPLEVGVGVHSESNFFAGITNDVSEGGLFIATYDLLARGSEIDVSLHLPGGFQIHARGVVRWIRDPRDHSDCAVRPGMGVQFVDLSAEARLAVSEFIANRAPLFHIN